MKNVWRRSSALLTAAAMTAAFIPTTVTAQDTAVATSDGTTVTVKDYTDNVPYESQIAMYNANGDIETIGTDLSYGSTAYTNDIAQLKSTISSSNGTYTQYASKTGQFATASDAQNGIAQLTFNAVGTQEKVTPYDVVIVLDESGSMNMLSSNDKATNISPDLNPDHYYCIPASVGFGNTKDIYFKLNTIGDGTIAFRPWYLYEGDVWAALQKAYPELNSDLFNNAFKNQDSFITAIKAWNPAKQLYYMDAQGNPQPIALTTTNAFDSPAETNAYGCYDRMTIEKNGAKSLVSTIAATGADARVAVVGFNGSANTECGLTDVRSGEATIDDALNKKVGSTDTNYTKALEQASSILTNRSKDGTSNRPAYVIFISDGNPWSGKDTYAAAASTLKSQTEAVYAVGINSGALTALSTVASAPASTYAVDCKSTSDFSLKLNSIAQTISNSSVLTDTIGDNYSLLVDANHPMTLNGVKYDTLPDAVSFNADTNQVTWNVEAGPLETGENLQFYVQLDPTLLTAESTSAVYPTNGDASLDYFSKTSTGEVKGNTVTLNSPSVHYDVSNLPAALTSDKMENNDPSVLGTKVTDDDVITYTIKVTNDGTVNAKNVAVKEYVPLNTTYVPDANGTGTYSEGTKSIAWTIDEIPAGETRSVSFQVKVNKGVKASTPIEMIDDTFTWGWGTAADYAVDDPICVGNKLENPTPEKPTTVIPTEPTPVNPVVPEPVTPVVPEPVTPVAPRPVTPVTNTTTDTTTTTDTVTTEQTTKTTTERPSTPNTGDATNAGLAAGVFCVSIAVVIALLAYRRKNLN